MTAAATVSGLIELIEQGFVPDDGAELISVLEMLPEMCEKLAWASQNLADWIISQPDVPDSAADRVTGMQVHLNGARDEAGEAYLDVAGTASFWTGEGGAAV
jgi:hypothetical protein